MVMPASIHGLRMEVEVVVEPQYLRWEYPGRLQFYHGFSHYRYTLGTTIDADPLFFSSTDFHLQPASPAIDAGLTFKDVPYDFDGNARPNGTAYDIGADEF